MPNEPTWTPATPSQPNSPSSTVAIHARRATPTPTWTKSQLREVVADAIYKINDLEPPETKGSHPSVGRPVFEIVFVNDDRLVVKLETGITMRNGNRYVGRTKTYECVYDLMHQVSSEVVVEILSEAEIEQLSLIASCSDYFKRALSGIAEHSQFATKMRRIDNLVSLADRHDDDKKKRKVAALMPSLKGNAQAWRSLGAIVAVDLLIGSQDRIVVDTDKANATTFRIQNAGNIFFITNAEGSAIVEAVGLDSFDPGLKLVSEEMTAQKDELAPKWEDQYGRHLKDGGQRTAFARGVVEAMKELATTLGVAIDPGKEEESAFVAGMADAQSKIGRWLNVSGTLPVIAERAKWLGWIVSGQPSAQKHRG